MGRPFRSQVTRDSRRSIRIRRGTLRIPRRYASMSFETLLGAFAALCSTASFAPQAVKIIRSRQTKDISLWMYVLTVTGFAAWTSYGVALGRWPLIAANGIRLLLSAFILLLLLLLRVFLAAVVVVVSSGL